MEELVGTPRGDAKLQILTNGLDMDFESIKENTDPEDLKTNRSKFSDKHHLPPEADVRDLIQDEILLEDENGTSISKVYFRDDSPLLLTAEDGHMMLEEKQPGRNQQINDVDVSPVPVWSYEDETYEGDSLSEYVPVIGADRIAWAPYIGCQEFEGGEQCKFCGLSPGRLDFDSPKPSVLDISDEYDGDVEAWWGEYRERVRGGTLAAFEKIQEDDIRPHRHFMVLAGNMDDKDFAWDMATDILSDASEIVDFGDMDSYWNLFPPEDFSRLQEAKDLGFQQAQFNLEVYDPERFQEVAPGKSRKYGYDQMREALRYAVDTFGEGNARTNMVLGSEPVENLARGAEELAEEGVVTDYSIFFPRPASVWNDREPPEPETVMEAAREIARVNHEYGFDPLYCDVSSRSSIANVVQEVEY